MLIQMTTRAYSSRCRPKLVANNPHDEPEEFKRPVSPKGKEVVFLHTRPGIESPLKSLCHSALLLPAQDHRRSIANH
jgi:hypothetical protein